MQTHPRPNHGKEKAKDLIHYRFAQMTEGDGVHELLEMDEAVAVSI